MTQAISLFSMLAQAAQGGPETSFFQTGTFLFLLLIVAVAVGLGLARLISKSLAVSDYTGRLAIVLVSLTVAGLMIYSKWPPKFGVDLRGGINMIGSLNLSALEDESGGDRPQAVDIIPALMARVNPAGTKEIMIRPLGNDKIEVTMPTVDLQEANDTWDRLVKTGKLEFRILTDSSNDASTVQLARELAATGDRSRFVRNADGETIAAWVNLARQVDGNGAIQRDAPFKFVPRPGNLVRDKSTGQLVNLLNVRLTGDAEKQGRQLADWAKEQGIRTLQILVNVPSEDRNVEGRHLTGVSSQPDEKGRNSVAFNLNSEGSLKMGMLTRMNIQRPMGIVLDGQLHSAPEIQSAIYKRGSITGNFTKAEVDDLIINLKSGKLDVALNKEPISSDFIESTLGNELKQKGIFAILASLVLVLVFMVVYYRFAGIVATVALLLNLVLIMALVMAIEQPLSLTGLAGLVLTVGMSVDANVLIFERIREELDRGAALRMAIRNGFDKATTTIVDANVTTLITAIVLYIIGTEQIKGFSVTLILGILMSMFTAIFVSRLIFDIWERKRWLTKLSMTRILERNTFDFLGKVSLTAVGSVLLIVGGITAVVLLGSRILDQDLRGGSTARMVFKEAQDIKQIRETLDALDIVHEPTGEKVEFTVNGYGGGAGDEENAHKKFKVDSNLPAYEGEGEPFRELDEILADTFKGQLLLHDAQIQGMTTAAPSGQAPASETPAAGQDVGLKWEGLPLSPAALTTSILTYPQEQGSGESAGSSQESQPPTESAPATQEPAETAPAEVTPPQENVEPAVAEPAQVQEPGETPALTAPQQEPGEGDAAGEAPTGRTLVEIARTMTVSPEISGKSLRALIQESSVQCSLPLEEDQIKVDSPDVKEDESPESTVSKSWTVTLQVGDETEADTILRTWQERFNATPYFPTSSAVGGQIADQTKYQALAAVFASLLGIIAYVWIRFQNLAFGLAAVIALIHDVLIVLGAIALSHWLAGALGFLGIEEFKISLEIIAALLTVIGYSLNDTIVVFDRIREVRGKRTEITGEMINVSISQTLSRTILTSLTTFIVVFILYLFGGDSIHGFAFALVVGVVVGTYSSIFVASPALLWLMNTVGLNPGEVEPEKAVA